MRFPPRISRLSSKSPIRAIGGFDTAFRRAEDVEAMLDMLADRTTPPDERLPDTGIGLPRERALGSRFIIGDAYGTRCSTVRSSRVGTGMRKIRWTVFLSTTR